MKIFHTAKDDTSKIKAIRFIVEESWDDNVWPKYNWWLFNFLEVKLKESNPDPIVKKSLQIAYAATINNIGFLYQDLGKTYLALDYYHKSLKIQEELNDKNGLADTYNNIGIIHKNQGDISLALQYLHKSLQMAEEIGDKGSIASTYNNLGVMYQNEGELDLALEYHLNGLKINQDLGLRREEALSYSNIGGLYSLQGKSKLALEYSMKSLKIREEIGDRRGMSLSYNNIGTVISEHWDELGLEENEALNEAKMMGMKGLDIALELNVAEIIRRNAHLLQKIAAKQGNFKEAYEMRNLEIKMADSILSEKNLRAAAQQEAKYVYEKEQALKDKEFEKQVAIEQKEKENQKLVSIFVSAGLIMLLIFSIIIFSRLKVSNKQKAIIEQAHNELEEKSNEILDSISYARRIQSAILPPINVFKENLKESFIFYRPKDIVAGDFYWMETKEENNSKKILFAAADCTGHGVPGAMVSVVCNNGLNRAVREFGLSDPGEILDKTREIVIQEFEKSAEDVKDGMDIALCSIEANTLQYAGAHNPLWIIRKGEILETKANKQPIGQFDNPQSYQTHTFSIEAGDSIYIFSDGFIDQFGGENGKKFKIRAFRELLISIQDQDMDEQKLSLQNVFDSWKGDLEQVDDICVIGVRV